jgi:replicative DNA helicase
MSINQLVQRIISAQSEVWLSRIKTGNLEAFHMDMLMKKGVMVLEDANIYIDDTAGLSITQLRSKARRMVMKDNVGLIIVDYLQLIEGNKEKTGAAIGSRR